MRDTLIFRHVTYRASDLRTGKRKTEEVEKGEEKEEKKRKESSGSVGESLSKKLSESVQDFQTLQDRFLELTSEIQKMTQDPVDVHSPLNEVENGKELEEKKKERESVAELMNRTAAKEILQQLIDLIVRTRNTAELEKILPILIFLVNEDIRRQKTMNEDNMTSIQAIKKLASVMEPAQLSSLLTKINFEDGKNIEILSELEKKLTPPTSR